jgi:signal transduction histidine kinase
MDIAKLAKENIIIDGDENYLAMLINNLLSNAQQYAAKHVRITTQQTCNSVSMCIEDDGPGISKEMREHVFKPFTRGESDTVQQGYGMGLAIVVRVAAWHGGKVSISQSEVLGGAKFKVVFKRASH